MDKRTNPFTFPIFLEDKEAFLNKFFVKTDCIKFFEKYFERNATYVNFVVEGPRGSGKTSCLFYLYRLLSRDRRNLVIYHGESFYPFLGYGNHEENYYIFLLGLYRALLHSFHKNSEVEIARREHTIRVLFFETNRESRKREIDELTSSILSDIYTMLEKISKVNDRVIFLLDNIDKFPFSSLKDISANLQANNIVLRTPKPLEVTFVCAGYPMVSSEFSSLLRSFSGKETVIVDVTWDLGYSAEIIRCHVENLLKKKLNECFDDGGLFSLYTAAHGNPRNILEILRSVWEDMRKRASPMALSEVNNIIEYQKRFFSAKNEVNIEDKFKSGLKPYWERILLAKRKQDKGKTLEELLRCLFGHITGMSIAGTNVRTLSEELDILVVNEASDPFLSRLGTPILVECKKWNRPVGAKEVNWFVSKVKRRSLRVGILVAWEGISGTEYRDAKAEIKRALEEGITIITVTKDQLMRVYSERDFVYLLKDCYYGVYKL